MYDYFFRLKLLNISTFTKELECKNYPFLESSCVQNDFSTCFDFKNETKCDSYEYDMMKDDAFWSLAAEYDWVMFNLLI